MGLDYGHTCGTIDGHIDDFKGIVKEAFSALLDEACPLLESTGVRDDIIKNHVDSIYNECVEIFEDVRKCNEDMRRQAELQLDDLEREKDDLESEVDDKQTRIEELEYDLGVVEDRCADLEAENQTLQEEYE